MEETITLDLSRYDLVKLVCGIEPNYNLFDNPSIKKYGTYNGSHDKWVWNWSIDELSPNELWELYQLCKNSWF